MSFRRSLEENGENIAYLKEELHPARFDPLVLDLGKIIVQLLLASISITQIT
jgi:hypothetical protein